MLPHAVLDLAYRSPAGLLALHELAAAGCDRRRVASWERAGLVERVLPGLYRVAAHAVPPAQCLHAPLRYLARPDLPAPLITGDGALALRAVEGFALPVEPLVLVDRDRRVRLVNAPFRVRRVPLEQVQRERHHGVDTVDVAQALADAALDETLGARQLRLAVDDVRSRLRVPVTDLAARWAGIGHAGAQRLLSMRCQLEQESEGERAAFTQLFQRQPPTPDCQVVVLGRLRVDFVFLFAALIIEYLGSVHAHQFERDATRTFALEHAGYRVIAVTAAMLRDAVALAAHIHGIRRERERLAAAGRLPRAPLPPQPPRLTPLGTLVPDG